MANISFQNNKCSGNYNLILSGEKKNEKMN